MKRFISFIMMLFFMFAVAQSNDSVEIKKSDSLYVVGSFSPAKISISSDIDVQKELIQLKQEELTIIRDFAGSFKDLVSVVDNTSGVSPPIYILTDLYKIPKEKILSSYKTKNIIYRITTILSLLFLIYALYGMRDKFNKTAWPIWIGNSAISIAEFFIILYILPYALNYAINGSYYYYQELLNLSG